MKKYYAYFSYCLFIFPLVNAAENSTTDRWNGSEYRKNSSAQYHYGTYALSQILFKEDDIVLDVGCGTGELSAEMAKKVPQGYVMGIDKSNEMLQQAQTAYKDVLNLTFQSADVTTFKLDIKFTKAVALCSLSWILNQQEAYNKIAQTLIKGGTLTAIVSDNDCPLLTAYRKTMQNPTWHHNFKTYTPQFYPSTKKEIHSYLMEAGFSSAIVKQAEIASKKMNKETFMKVIGATPGVKDALPEEQYSLFIEDVTTEYMKQIKCSDENNIEISNGLFLVIAHKN